MATREEKATLAVGLKDDGVTAGVEKIRQSGKGADSSIVRLQKSITATERTLKDYGASSAQVAASLDAARAASERTGLGLEVVLKQVRALASKNGAAGLTEELRDGLEEAGVVARKAAEEVVEARDLMVEALGDTGAAVRQALEAHHEQAEAINDTRSKIDDLSDRFKIFGEGGEKLANALEGISDPARRVALTQELWNQRMAQGPTLMSKLSSRTAELNARVIAATGGALDLSGALGLGGGAAGAARSGVALGASIAGAAILAAAAAVAALGVAVGKFVAEGVKNWAASSRSIETGMKLVRAEVNALQDDLGGGVAEALDFELAPYAWEFALVVLRNQAEGAARDIQAVWSKTGQRFNVSLGQATAATKAWGSEFIKLNPILGPVRSFIFTGAEGLRNYAKTLDLQAVGATERWIEANIKLSTSIADARTELEQLSVTLQGELARMPFDEATEATRAQVLGAARPRREGGGGGGQRGPGAFHQGGVKDFVLELVEEGERAREAQDALDKRIEQYTLRATGADVIGNAQKVSDEFTRKRLALEAQLAASAERRQQAANDDQAALLAQAEAARTLVDALDQVAKASQGAALELAGMIGQMVVGAASAGDFGKALVAQVASLINTLAPAFVQMGLALFATETGNALGLIVAGGALASIAGGLSAFASKSPPRQAASGAARLERTADRLLASRDEAGRRPSQTVNVYIGNKQLRGAIVETVADAAGRGQLRLSA